MISLLYMVTGITLTAQTSWLLLWAVWGAPTSVWEYIALLGSLLLFVAGIMNVWKLSAAIYLVAFSEILIWSFYLPTIFVTIRSSIDPKNSSTFTLETFIAFFVVYGLLGFSTAIATRRLISARGTDRVN